MVPSHDVNTEIIGNLVISQFGDLDVIPIECNYI